MNELPLRSFHQGLNARWTELNGGTAVADYGDVNAEYAALTGAVAWLDLSFRGRLCVTGADRVAFLHGLVTNNVKDLKTGEGCYAALVSAKGKMQSDLNIYRLADELLLDFEPGLAATNLEWLEKYVIAADAQIVDVGPLYGLLSIQGPQAEVAMRQLNLGVDLSPKRMSFTTAEGPDGSLYLMNQPRTGAAGFDLFAPAAALAGLAERLNGVVAGLGGRACGWAALETARIERGIPRFGADMDATNLPPEAGLEERAISYNKGCYIGQEVIARIRTYGQVAKSLRGLRLADDLAKLPVKGDKLFKQDKEVGFITSAATSPRLNAKLALGYVRREANETGAELTLRTAEGPSVARIVPLPFAKNLA